MSYTKHYMSENNRNVFFDCNKLNNNFYSFQNLELDIFKKFLGNLTKEVFRDHVIASIPGPSILTFNTSLSLKRKMDVPYS